MEQREARGGSVHAATESGRQERRRCATRGQSGRRRRSGLHGRLSGTFSRTAGCRGRDQTCSAEIAFLADGRHDEALHYVWRAPVGLGPALKDSDCARAHSLGVRSNGRGGPGRFKVSQNTRRATCDTSAGSCQQSAFIRPCSGTIWRRSPRCPADRRMSHG